MVTILDFMGKGIVLVLYYRDEEALARTCQKIGSICGKKALTMTIAFPKPSLTMKKIDWKIISVMADDARMDLEDVERQSGASIRTIQRRLAKMIEGKAIYLSGRPVYERMSGLSCNFLVFCPEIEKKQAMDERVLSEVKRIERSDTGSKEYSMFSIDCENPKIAEETLAWLKTIDGVKSVRLGITKEAIHVQDWLKEEVRKRASS